jgi:hypothetical protein
LALVRFQSDAEAGSGTHRAGSAVSGFRRHYKSHPRGSGGEACQKAGIASDLVTGIGLLLLACTAIYVIPKTAILGAILLTGYLGGAVTLHVIARAGNFPIFFALGFGVLVWTGLALREPRLVRLILSRQY